MMFVLLRSRESFAEYGPEQTQTRTPQTLVRSKADTNAGSADKHSEVHLAGGHSLADLVSRDGIVEALLAVRSEVEDVVALLLEMLLDDALEVDRARRQSASARGSSRSPGWQGACRARSSPATPRRPGGCSSAR